MKNVLIATMHSIINYGSFYQTVATIFLLKKIGCQATILDYQPLSKRPIYFLFGSFFEKKIKLKRIISDVAYFRSRFVRWLRFRCAQKKFYNVTQLYKSFAEIKKSDLQFDVFLTGSDQVWNPVTNQGVDSVFFLEFVEGQKKVAFSASIGVENFSIDQIRKIKSYLNEYSAISVREVSAQKFLKEKCNVNSVVTLDPTLMLLPNEWSVALPLKNIKLPVQRYVLAYILGRETRVMNCAEKIANMMGLKIIKIGGAMVRGSKKVVNKVSVNPLTALFYFKNADFIVTNSFHGTALSIEFNKQFFVTSSILNPRLESILNIFGLEDRFLANDKDVKNVLDEIDYEKINLKLNELRSDSYCFLNNSINF